MSFKLYLNSRIAHIREWASILYDKQNFCYIKEGNFPLEMSFSRCHVLSITDKNRLPICFKWETEIQTSMWVTSVWPIPISSLLQKSYLEFPWFCHYLGFTPSLEFDDRAPHETRPFHLAHDVKYEIIWTYFRVWNSFPFVLYSTWIFKLP